MKHTQFDYVNHFHCLAGRCPDTCCKDWQIILDEDAMARYRAMPGALGEQVRAAMLTQNSETRFREQDGKCVLLREDGLCPIQAAYGADALPETLTAPDGASMLVVTQTSADGTSARSLCTQDDLFARAYVPSTLSGLLRVVDVSLDWGEDET